MDELFKENTCPINLTISEAFSLFIKLHWSNTRSKANLANIKRIVKEIGHFYIDGLTTYRIKSYLQKWNYLSPATMNKDRGLIINLYNKLFEWKDLGHYMGYDFSNLVLPKKCPAKLVKKYCEKKYSRKRFVTKEDLSNVIEHINDDGRNILLMVLFTALRRGDLMKLSKFHINEENNCIEIVQSKTGIPIKIFITPQIKQIINSAKGENILNFKNFRRNFLNALTKSKVKYFQPCRDLRKTTLSRLYEIKPNIKLIQEMAGHANPVMTDSYIIRRDDDYSEAHKIMSKEYIFKNS